VHHPPTLPVSADGLAIEQSRPVAAGIGVRLVEQRDIETPAQKANWRSYRLRLPGFKGPHRNCRVGIGAGGSRAGPANLRRHSLTNQRGSHDV